MLDHNETRSGKEISQFYDYFKSNYPVLLEKASVIIGKKELDFSIDEIDYFGEKTLSQFPNGLQLHEQGQLLSQEFAHVFMAYYGAAWIHYFGGEWYYSKKKSEYGYGLPQLIEYGPPDEVWSALSPYIYLLMLYKGSIQKLSKFFVRELEIFARRGITNFKRTESEK